MRENDETVVRGTEGNRFVGDGGQFVVTEWLCLVSRECDVSGQREKNLYGFFGDIRRCAVAR